LRDTWAGAGAGPWGRCRATTVLVSDTSRPRPATMFQRLKVPGRSPGRRGFEQIEQDRGTLYCHTGERGYGTRWGILPAAETYIQCRDSHRPARGRSRSKSLGRNRFRLSSSTFVLRSVRSDSLARYTSFAGFDGIQPQIRGNSGNIDNPCRGDGSVDNYSDRYQNSFKQVKTG